jgi:hypothetical protein
MLGGQTGDKTTPVRHGDSTEKYDRGIKAGHYRRLDTLQGYLLIAQDRFSVEVFQRRGDNPSEATDG